ncbi:sulfotransferase [Methylosoma difficile]
MDKTTRLIPDFLIVGAMKSGTTTLYQYLCGHPDIFMTTPKEPGYFSRDSVYQKGKDWYLSLFKDARAGQWLGEASTCYSRWPHFADVPKRIHAFNKDVKLIFIMRHPVERAYSHYGHSLFTDNKHYRSFEEALDAEPEILDASKYMSQINRFLEYFPKEQILLVDFDALISDPDAIMQTVQAFIGCNVINLSIASEIKANEAGEASIKRKLTKQIYKIRRLPGISLLVNVLLPAGSRNQLLHKLVDDLVGSPFGQWLKRRGKKRLSPLNANTRVKLLSDLMEDTKALEVYWGKDLSKWYQ